MIVYFLFYFMVNDKEVIFIFLIFFSQANIVDLLQIVKCVNVCHPVEDDIQFIFEFLSISYLGSSISLGEERRKQFGNLFQHHLHTLEGIPLACRY